MFLKKNHLPNPLSLNEQTFGQSSGIGGRTDHRPVMEDRFSPCERGARGGAST